PKVAENDVRMLRTLYGTDEEQLQQKALEIATKYGAPPVAMIAVMLQDWAAEDATRNRFVRAEALLEKEGEIFDRAGAAVPASARFDRERDLARALRQQNKWAEAGPHYAACAAKLKQDHSDDSDLITVLQNLAACQRESKSYSQCKETCSELLPLLTKRKP